MLNDISPVSLRIRRDREGCNSDMGTPIPKTLVIWASAVTLTLTQIAKVI